MVFTREMCPLLLKSLRPGGKTGTCKKLFALKKESNSSHTILVGFDGFTDEIITCVDKRQDKDRFDAIQSIEQFAARIQKAAGKSTNIELISKEKRIGGNAPLLAQALIATNQRLILIGALGIPEIEPLFQPLAARCHQAISIAPSASTEALEFQDGKILFGKMENVLHIDTEILLKHLPEKTLIKLFTEVDTFASVNWTMIPAMTVMWEYFHEMVFCKLPPRNRTMFVDLADPSKRTAEDILNALLTLRKISKQLQIILGLNEKESEIVSEVLGITSSHHSSKKEHLLHSAKELCKTLGFAQVVIHSHELAVASTQETFAAINVPYCKNPLTTTGGGDNFNAGYLLGHAHSLSLEESLLIACATSGFYVRNGKSPTLYELARFLEEWGDRA